MPQSEYFAFSEKHLKQYTNESNLAGEKNKIREKRIKVPRMSKRCEEI